MKYAFYVTHASMKIAQVSIKIIFSVKDQSLYCIKYLVVAILLPLMSMQGIWQSFMNVQTNRQNSHTLSLCRAHSDLPQIHTY